jgi:hypothetical protein
MNVTWLLMWHAEMDIDLDVDVADDNPRFNGLV